MTTTETHAPSYLRLLESGELEQRADALEAMLGDCRICPRDCGVNRLEDKIAACFAGRLPVVSSVVAHFGEEPFLTGTHGSGNVFFGLCNMRCVYCQNFQISQNYKHERAKSETTHEDLAARMIELQARGCHVINFVSPTHFVPQMVRAIWLAARQGLRLPIVYNTNAYDSVEILRLLDGIVDVWLPDLKYWDAEAGREYSHVQNYPEHARAAIREMARQVGDELVLGPDGIARRGLVIRHLVLPNDLAGTEECLEWIAREISPRVTVSLMAQYYPTNKAERYPLLSRGIRVSEYERALKVCERVGLTNVLIQEPREAPEYYRPDFERAEPFVR